MFFFLLKGFFFEAITERPDEKTGLKVISFLSIKKSF